jgi:hypothetical protein
MWLLLDVKLKQLAIIYDCYTRHHSGFYSFIKICSRCGRLHSYTDVNFDCLLICFGLYLLFNVRNYRTGPLSADHRYDRSFYDLKFCWVRWLQLSQPRNLHFQRLRVFRSHMAGRLIWLLWGQNFQFLSERHNIHIAVWLEQRKHILQSSFKYNQFWSWSGYTLRCNEKSSFNNEYAYQLHSHHSWQCSSVYFCPGLLN